MADAGVLGDLNEGLDSKGKAFWNLSVQDVGEAAVVAAEIGETK